MTQESIRHIAEIVLRVSDLEKMVEFYQETVGFRVIRRGGNIVFLKIADLDSPLGHGGHPQVLGLVDRQIALDAQRSTFDHLAFEIPLEHLKTEKDRLELLGLEIHTITFDWSHARALFFRDPEGNQVEFIAHDDSVG